MSISSHLFAMTLQYFHFLLFIEHTHIIYRKLLHISHISTIDGGCHKLYVIGGKYIFLITVVDKSIDRSVKKNETKSYKRKDGKVTQKEKKIRDKWILILKLFSWKLLILVVFFFFFLFHVLFIFLFLFSPISLGNCVSSLVSRMDEYAVSGLLFFFQHQYFIKMTRGIMHESLQMRNSTQKKKKLNLK